MAKPIFGFISNIFKPAADLVNNLHTSDAERLELQAKFFQIESELTLKILDYEAKLMEAQTSIIMAEANSQSWIARNWRPLTMLTFLVLVVADALAWLPNPLAPQAWELLKIGLGGYVVGRSAEKVVPAVADMVKKSKKG